MSLTAVSSTPTGRRWARWLCTAVMAAMCAGLYGVYTGTLHIPEPYNPWAPLNVAATPSLLTRYKLQRARNDPGAYMAALAQTGRQYTTLPDRVTGSGCGFTDAVLLRQANVRLGSPISLSCPMALSLAMWERHALQPAALARFGEPVVALQYLGSYACRNINTGESNTSSAGARSRHSTADALDIEGFTLASGRRITLLKDWHGARDTSPPDAAALLLTDARQGACRFFNGVLSPDYNAAHRDHFHLETGGGIRCAAEAVRLMVELLNKAVISRVVDIVKPFTAV